METNETERKATGCLLPSGIITSFSYHSSSSLTPFKPDRPCSLALRSSLDHGDCSYRKCPSPSVSFPQEIGWCVEVQHHTSWSQTGSLCTSYFCYSAAVWPWPKYLTSLSLSFFLLWMRVIIELLERIKKIILVKILEQWLVHTKFLNASTVISQYNGCVFRKLFLIYHHYHYDLLIIFLSYVILHLY